MVDASVALRRPWPQISLTVGADLKFPLLNQEFLMVSPDRTRSGGAMNCCNAGSICTLSIPDITLSGCDWDNQVLTKLVVCRYLQML